MQNQQSSSESCSSWRRTTKITSYTQKDPSLTSNHKACYFLQGVKEWISLPLLQNVQIWIIYSVPNIQAFRLHLNISLQTLVVVKLTKTMLLKDKNCPNLNISQHLKQESMVSTFTRWGRIFSYTIAIKIISIRTTRAAITSTVYIC